ncbi:MAG TPA: helix-turn-helix domain-containing protein [Polyangiaceae bacterium]|nr:helix-turn-helix domain-containing protein [Polyangiaceae bacterium]
MLSAVEVLPAGPGEPNDDDVFPLQDRIRLRDNFGFVLQELRKRGPTFRALAKGPWAVFIAIATHFQLHADAWPGQEAIAHLSGCSTRAVRTHVSQLERAGIYELRRERRPDGGERIYYRPGPVMLRELATFRTDYPKDKPKVLRPVQAAKAAAPVAHTLNPPPERIAGPLAERLSMEPDQEREPDPDPREPSSSCEKARARPGATVLDQEEQPTVSREDQEIARWALRERIKRKRPKRPAPRWFDRNDVEMVARCVAAVDGDRAAKEQAQREAIAGAFCTSRDGPPTARFVWEKLDHFFDHVERGQTKLRNEALEAQRRQREREEDEVDRARSIQHLAESRAGESAKWSPPTPAELAKTRAEFEQIATRATPQFRGTLEKMIAHWRELEEKARVREGTR